MTLPAASDPGHYMLGAAEAARMWNWTLARQGLADDHLLGSVTAIADAVLGLHAARLPSPYAIIAARAASETLPGTLYTEPVRAALLTVRCMRKTLHALPLHLAAAAHAATVHYRERDARRAIASAGLSANHAERLIGDILALLADGPTGHRAIEAALAPAGTGVAAIRLALRLAWERGDIAYRNISSAWNRELRTFAATSSAYPGLDLAISREQAAGALISAYFDRYGPATIRDATWWSGLPAGDIRAALAASGRPVARVSAPWSREDHCLMFADRLEEFRSAEPVLTGTKFLGHEDSALKAYFQTRSRYLAGLPQRQAFNQIGEALPTVISDGAVVGTWRWNPSTRGVEVSLLARDLPQPTKRQIRAHAKRLASTLLLHWAP